MIGTHSEFNRGTETEDLKKAQEYHDRLKAEFWRVTKLGEKPRRRWQEAVVRWCRETRHKATHERDVHHFRELDKYLSRKYLDEIGRDMVDHVTAERLKDGVSHVTVNRMLAVLRAVLRRAAYDWEWLDRVPKIRLLPERKRRVRFLSREEADRLLAELPGHLAEMVGFTLATGLRQANVRVWSGPRWIWSGALPGSIRIRQRQGRRSRSLSTRTPCWCCVGKSGNMLRACLPISRPSRMGWPSCAGVSSAGCRARWDR